MRSSSRERRHSDGRLPDHPGSPSPSSRFVSSRRVITERDTLLRSHEFKSYKSTRRRPSSHEEDSSGEESFFMTAPESSASAMHAHVLQTEHHEYTTTSNYTPGTSGTNIAFRDLLPYYFPMLSWVGHYCPEFLVGDLIGGISLATFQIPLAISYATTLAKVPMTCGLYSLGVAPLIYMLLGSVPQMITGPEAPISLIVGQAVEPLLHHSKKKQISPIEYVVAITFLSGITLLGFGLGRFGFLDNVLCDSLLKGFISGVGIVMVINSMIPLLGLERIFDDIVNSPDGPDIHSSFDKFKFVLHHYKDAHALTFKVSMTAFLAIMLLRHLKKAFSGSKKPFLQKAVYLPEILIVVLTSTLLCRSYHWHQQGLEIVGSISDVSTEFTLYNPLSSKSLHFMKKLSSSGLICAMLGFFESTTASKSLGSRYDLPISSNRELVALGSINLACSVFGGLPSFGGYGRSKINAMSAKTTFSGAIMGTIALLTARYILGYLHYIPKCILSVITAVIGISLMSEAPNEIAFHWRSRGHNEVVTFTITVLTTIFYSMEAGIAVGLIYSLIRVIKTSAVSNIQILGRVPGTNTFLDADLANEVAIAATEGPEAGIRRASQLNLFTDNITLLNYNALEEIEGCLIIKIPEPLTFTNASDLRARLKRLEMYGSAKAHPALKRSRDVSMSKYMVFDLEGMLFIDSSAAQILQKSLLAYHEKGIRSFFIRVSKNRKVRKRLANTGITQILKDDLLYMNYPEMATRIKADLFKMRSNNSKRVSREDSEARFALTESENVPYFEHIRGALRVIDNYESKFSAVGDIFV